jgi:subtilisin family serine protease
VRTSERSLDIDGEYNYNDENLGEGVDAYIIDTGIYRDHVEFGEPTRARFGFSAIVGEEQDYDGNGHGTHVAGTVGSTKYGIAKKATLVAVKVLSASGSGSTAGVIDGVEWTCKDHTEKKNKCVANMSLGGGKSDAMNRAVDELSSCGCATAVASGNEARDACLGSPASSEKVYTVNSMDTEGGFRVPRVSCLLSV